MTVRWGVLEGRVPGGGVVTRCSVETRKHSAVIQVGGGDWLLRSQYKEEERRVCGSVAMLKTEVG